MVFTWDLGDGMDGQRTSRELHAIKVRAQFFKRPFIPEHSSTPKVPLPTCKPGLQEVIPTMTVPSLTCHSDADNVHERVRHYVFIPVVTLILLTNSFILAYFAKTKRLKRPGAWLIANLCVADLCLGLASIAVLFTRAEEQTLELCLLRTGATVSAVVASIFFLLAIAVDRFIAIIRALVYTSIVTPRRVVCAIILVWLLSLAIGFMPQLGWNNRVYSGHCSFSYVQAPSYVIFLETGCLLPIVVILVIYLHLYSNARWHIRKMEAINALHPPRRGSTPLSWSSRDWRSFRQLMALIGCLLITWLPFIVASFMDISPMRTPCWLKDVIGTHFLVLGMSNSILNPLVYTLSTRHFKRSLRNFLVKHSCLKPVVQQ